VRPSHRARPRRSAGTAPVGSVASTGSPVDIRVQVSARLPRTRRVLRQKTSRPRLITLERLNCSPVRYPGRLPPRCSAPGLASPERLDRELPYGSLGVLSAARVVVPGTVPRTTEPCRSVSSADAPRRIRPSTRGHRRVGTKTLSRFASAVPGPSSTRRLYRRARLQSATDGCFRSPPQRVVRLLRCLPRRSSATSSPLAFHEYVEVPSEVRWPSARVAPTAPSAQSTDWAGSN